MKAQQKTLALVLTLTTTLILAACGIDNSSFITDSSSEDALAESSFSYEASNSTDSVEPKSENGDDSDNDDDPTEVTLHEFFHTFILYVPERGFEGMTWTKSIMFVGEA